MFERTPNFGDLADRDGKVTTSVDIDTLEERARQIEKGVRAETLLETEVFSETLDEYFHGLLFEFVSTTSDQADRREEIYFEIRALRGIHATLKSWIQTAESLVELTKTEAEDDDIDGE